MLTPTLPDRFQVTKYVSMAQENADLMEENRELQKHFCILWKFLVESRDHLAGKDGALTDDGLRTYAERVFNEVGGKL